MDDGTWLTECDRFYDHGNRVGQRLFELIVWREKTSRREIRLISLLQFIQTTIWKTLFDKTADGLEKSTENEDECDHFPILCTAFLFS